MMKTLFYLLAGVLLFAGCLDTDDNLQPVILGPIDLSDLQEGQQSRFISYEMNCDSMEFQWTGDTLVVRVVSDGENFFLAEWLTDSSRTVRIDGENPIENVSDRVTKRHSDHPGASGVEAVLLLRE